MIRVGISTSRERSNLNAWHANFCRIAGIAEYAKQLEDQSLRPLDFYNLNVKSGECGDQRVESTGFERVVNVILPNI